MSIKEIRNAWSKQTYNLMQQNGPGNIQLTTVGKTLLEKGIIESYSLSKRIVYESVLKKHFHLRAPWTVFDIPFGSIGWRMGAGEGYLSRWHSYTRLLPEYLRNTYFSELNYPSEWKPVIERVFREYTNST
jgi:hypothetical protein